ncbi:MAG: hypothetical protein HGB18_00185 [Candidatus Moranbacteria bacterium]|nr:hypothetical protein [Candidatus Moranbacteria bacterium]
MQTPYSLIRLMRLSAYFRKNVTFVRQLRQAVVFFRILRSFVSTSAGFELYEATIGPSEDEESDIEDTRERLAAVADFMRRSFVIDGRQATSDTLLRMAESVSDLPALVRNLIRESFERAEREAPGPSFWYASVYALQGEVMRELRGRGLAGRFHTAFEAFLSGGTTLDLRERVRAGSDLLLRASVEMAEDDIFDRTMYKLADDAVLFSNVLALRLNAASLTRSFHDSGVQFAARRVEEARERIQAVYLELESERYQAAFEPLLSAFEFLDDGFMGLMGRYDRRYGTDASPTSP